VAGAAGYEYSLSGDEGSFQPVPSPTSFVPDGLVQGTNTVYVRAYDANGNRGPTASFSFVYDTVAPGGVVNLIAFADGRVQFDASGADQFYEYRLGGSGVYLYLGSATSFTTADLLKGPRTVQVHSIDLAGNVGPDSITTIVPRWVPAKQEGADKPPKAVDTAPVRTGPVIPGVAVTPQPSSPTVIRPGAWKNRGHRLFLRAHPVVVPHPPSPLRSKGGNGSGPGSRPAPQPGEVGRNRAGLKERLRSLLPPKPRNHNR
jgi:hypothetical protein